MIHPVETLWAEHAPPHGYPPGVVAVPTPIPGLAFFPGGHGLWGCVEGQPLPPFPVGGVMILGHNFDSEGAYRKSLEVGRESTKNPTWRNLLKVLAEAGIAPECCFFTNLYMGLIGGSNATGKFPGASDPPFVEHCKRFLVRQLQAQRPSLLVTLGIEVPPVVGHLSPQLAPWAAGKGLRHLDSVGPVQVDVTFPDIENFKTTAVALTHPSKRDANVGVRKYRGATGHQAEVRMLHDACALAGIDTGARATSKEPVSALDAVSLARIQEFFHGLIRSRAREGGIPIPRHLPSLHDLRVDEAEPRWFAVPGMYGGFSYHLQTGSHGLRLVTESWSRVVGGSGMRHTITPTQVVLEDEGFV